MDRTKIIELAKEWLTENEWHEGDSEADEQAELADLLGSGIPEMMTDFALSLLKWKSVADGLPEVDAIYQVIEREGNTRFYAYYIGRKEVWVTEDGADIVNVIAYIPVPIPEYVKEQR